MTFSHVVYHLSLSFIKSQVWIIISFSQMKSQVENLLLRLTNKITNFTGRLYIMIFSSLLIKITKSDFHNFLEGGEIFRVRWYDSVVLSGP